MVYLRGAGNSGGTHVVAGQTVATLPVGFRPGSYHTGLCLVRFPNDSSGIAEIGISSSGVIYITNLIVNPGAKQFIHFDNIAFSTLP